MSSDLPLGRHEHLCRLLDTVGTLDTRDWALACNCDTRRRRWRPYCHCTCRQLCLGDCLMSPGLLTLSECFLNSEWQFSDMSFGSGFMKITTYFCTNLINCALKSGKLWKNVLTRA